MKQDSFPSPEDWSSYVDGELDPTKRNEIAHLLEQSDDCKAMLVELEEEKEWLKQQIQTTFPSSVSTPDVSHIFQRYEDSVERTQHVVVPSNVETTRWNWGAWFGWSLAFAAILLLVVPTTWQFFQVSNPGSNDTPASLVPKSPISMDLYLLWSPKGQTRPRRANSTQELIPGDLIQFGYVIPRSRHIMIAAINEQGNTFLLVHHQKKSIRLHALRGNLPSSSSFLMDDYIGKERYFVVASTKPFVWSSLKRALEKGWRGNNRNLDRFTSLKGPWSVVSFLIVKKKGRMMP